MSNRYVYGVVAQEDTVEFETEAVTGASEIYPISHRGLAALVSDVETTDIERTDEDAHRHDDVLREIMEREGGRAVVPMRYGMVFESDRALKNVLRGGAPAFKRTLREIGDGVELGVKIVREDGEAVDREAVLEGVTDELEPLAEESTDSRLFSDRLVMNRSYLVPREDREAFNEAVGRLEETYDDLTFRYTGPFAPYSFVDIQIGAQ